MRISATTLLLLAAEAALPECGTGTPPGRPAALDRTLAAQDARLTAAVRRAIRADHAASPDAGPCTITTTGGVVTLRGLVVTPEERGAVAARARGVRGVVHLRNELEVRAR